MEFTPYEGSPVVEEEEEEEDEVAEAVIELKELSAKHDTQMQEITAKVARAENEVQALKNDMAELRAAIAAGAGVTPAEVTAEAVAAPLETAVTPPAKKGRLQRAAEKRAAVSEPSESPVGEPMEVSEPPGTSGTSRRVQRKK